MQRAQRSIGFAFVFVLGISFAPTAQAAYHFGNFHGRPPIHILAGTSKMPQGVTPAEIKNVYHLPAGGGHGTIVIVGAYDDATIEADLAAFNKQFGLRTCTSANGCFAKHKMSAKMNSDSNWNMEMTLDVEWAHAIAPDANIVLVEAATPSGANLVKAVDYAASIKDASAISMSWGGTEFPEELSYDSHFASVSGAPFFASSGDNGTGASWPAASPKVVAVGGTSLAFSAKGLFKKETAWTGSGGGVSAYEKEPSFQTDYSIPKAGGMRAIPDVAYNADPSSGFSIVCGGTWYVVGGTSAGAPQWAAIATLGNGAANTNFYADKSSAANASYFRDITSGTNGSCGYLCTARKHYDYVTGLGSPLTVRF